MSLFLVCTLGICLLGLFFFYWRVRLHSVEDRYMEHYGKEDWSSSDMELVFGCEPVNDVAFKQAFRERISQYLQTPEGRESLLFETAAIKKQKIIYQVHQQLQLTDVCSPRNGVYFDFSQPAKVRIIWSHIQCDGVGIWRTIRPLVDDNPPLIPYRKVSTPPPLLPELLAFPNTLRSIFIKRGLPDSKLEKPYRSLKMWPAELVQQRKEQYRLPFNLISSAMVLEQVFTRHPDVEFLNAGLTVYFPFLQSRNRYGFVLTRVRRGDHLDIARQLAAQTKSPLRMWGASSLQSFMLHLVPKKQFLSIMLYYRQQVDVLISNLPVGQNPVSVAQIPSSLACYTPELSLPYYFLLMGTRHKIHLSCSSHFTQSEDFLSLGSTAEENRSGHFDKVAMG